MRNVVLQKKFNFEVPSKVISSLWNMYNKCLQSNMKIIHFNYNGIPVINAIELQYSKNNIDRNLVNIRLQENLKNQKTWKFFDEDVMLVDNFINEHFSSAFMFRFNVMPAKILFPWHSHVDNNSQSHARALPRVFIPMHDNTAIFSIRNKNVELSNVYNVGECWVWDVTNDHKVDNRNSINGRIMACFSIDPQTETKADIFV